MKSSIMKRAWEIRKAAATKFNCKISEIHFGECLRLAWAEARKGNEMNIIEKVKKETNWEVSIQTFPHGDDLVTFKSIFGIADFDYDGETLKASSVSSMNNQKMAEKVMAIIN